MALELRANRKLNHTRLGGPIDQLLRNPIITVTTGFGNIVPGVFTPGLAKHSKSFSLIDCIAVGVDDIQRNFEPKYEEFCPRTIWGISNAFTSAFKELDPIPEFKATAKLGEFLEMGSPGRSKGEGGSGRPPLVIATFTWQASGGNRRFPGPD